MLVQTILNRVHKIKGFVYGALRFGEWEGDPTLKVEEQTRAGSRGRCSKCGKPGPAYDMRKTRRFEFFPFWGYRVFLFYWTRWVNYPTCGVKVKRVPWAEGKSETTLLY